MSAWGRSIRLLAAMLLAALLPASVVALLVAFESQTSVPVAADLARVQVVSGQRWLDPSGLTVLGRPGDQVILVVTGQPVDASSHPFLRLRLDGIAPEALLQFFWIDSQGQDPVTREIGFLAEDLAHHVDLSISPRWEGRVVKYGLMVTDPSGQGFRLHDLALLPMSLENRLRNLFSEWFYFEPWSQRSINFEAGVMNRKLGPCTPLAAGWVILAWMIYAVLVRCNPWRIGRGPLLALLLAGWGLLEAKWLWNGVRQFEQSHALFAGRDDGAALQATIDVSLYRYADRLLREVLPRPPVNLIVLSGPQSPDYKRLRFLYFLLPHNVYSSDRVSAAELRRKGGYLLVFSGHRKTDYDRRRGEIRLPDGVGVAAVEIDHDPIGDLYRIDAE